MSSRKSMRVLAEGPRQPLGWWSYSVTAVACRLIRSVFPGATCLTPWAGGQSRRGTRRLRQGSVPSEQSLVLLHIVDRWVERSRSAKKQAIILGAETVCPAIRRKLFRIRDMRVEEEFSPPKYRFRYGYNPSERIIQFGVKYSF